MRQDDWIDLNEAHQQREIKALYVSADVDGLWYPSVEPGQSVMEGDLLGVLRSFEGEDLKVVRAEKDGCVLYMTGTLFAPAGVALIAY